MHPKHAGEKMNSRIAFAQPGKGQIKLVYLSPRIHTVKKYDIINPKPTKCKSGTEVRWEPKTRPLKFEKAPLICNNEGDTLFPSLMKYVENVRQPTPVSKFMSKFRSRARIVECHLVNEITEVYENYVKDNSTSIYTEHYWETMPYPPPIIETDRDKKYNEYVSKRKIRITY